MSHRNDTWMIVCDFDGTISTVDATDALLDRYASAGWRDIEQDWADNRISSRECLVRQAALLQADLSQIDSLSDELQIDSQFAAFVDWCASQAIPIAIVSEGFDIIISKMLANHGLAHLPVYSNRLVGMTSRTYRLDTPFCADQCASNASVCKCALIRQLKLQTGSSHCLFVGDGRSDFCAAIHEADIVGAKSMLRDYLTTEHKSFVPIESFKDVTVLASDCVTSIPSLGSRL